MLSVDRLFWLLVAHAVTDVVGQSTRMEGRKARLLSSRQYNLAFPGALPMAGPEDGAVYENRHWGPWMLAHALLNGAGVALVTQNVWLGIAETVVHGITDTLKCEHKIGLLGDQMTHLVSKLVWAAL